MKDSIIQRCPRCGNWCQAEYKGFFDKWIKTIKDQSSGLADWGGKYFGDSGKIVGGVIGGYSGFVNGSLHAIAGEHYQFRCPRCNSEWSTNDDANDEIDTYYQNRWAIQKQTILETEYHQNQRRKGTIIFINLKVDCQINIMMMNHYPYCTTRWQLPIAIWGIGMLHYHILINLCLYFQMTLILGL